MSYRISSMSSGSVHYVTTGAGAHYDTETMLFEQYLGQDIPTRSGCHPKFEKQGNDMGEAICYYYWANQNVKNLKTDKTHLFF